MTTLWVSATLCSLFVTVWNLTSSKKFRPWKILTRDTLTKQRITRPRCRRKKTGSQIASLSLGIYLSLSHNSSKNTGTSSIRARSSGTFDRPNITSRLITLFFSHLSRFLIEQLLILRFQMIMFALILGINLRVLIFMDALRQYAPQSTFCARSKIRKIKNSMWCKSTKTHQLMTILLYSLG